MHTSRGSKHINLYVVFECAFHIFACMAQVLNFNIHACVVYASYRLEWWNEKLACIEYLDIHWTLTSGIRALLRMLMSRGI